MLQEMLCEGLPCLYNENEALVFSPYSRQLLVTAASKLKDGTLGEYLHEQGHIGTPVACAGTNTELQQLTIVLTSDCNLRCDYCFVKGGCSAEVISIHVIQQAVDKSCVMANKRGKRGLLVTFFGGEPTLEKDLIVQTVDYVREACANSGLVCKFGITTNGVCPESTLEYLIQENFFITVSTDGIPEVHDRHRHFPNGEPTSHILQKNLKFLAEREAKFLIRITCTADSVLQLPDAVKYFSGLGAQIIHIEAVSLAGRATETKGSGMVLRPDADVFVESLIKSVETAKKCGVSIMNSAYMNILVPSVHYCDGVGGNKLVVTYTGDYTTCLEVQDSCHPAKEWFLIGHSDGEKLNSSVFASKPIIETVPDCQNCFAKYICAGGCPTRNFHMEGDVYKVDEFRCKTTRSVLKYCMISLYNNISKKGD